MSSEPTFIDDYRDVVCETCGSEQDAHLEGETDGWTDTYSWLCTNCEQVNWVVEETNR